MLFSGRLRPNEYRYVAEADISFGDWPDPGGSYPLDHVRAPSIYPFRFAAIVIIAVPCQKCFSSASRSRVLVVDFTS